MTRPALRHPAMLALACVGIAAPPLESNVFTVAQSQEMTQ